jgi:hypothetical protein
MADKMTDLIVIPSIRKAHLFNCINHFEATCLSEQAERFLWQAERSASFVRSAIGREAVTKLDRTHVPNLHIIMRRADLDR